MKISNHYNINSKKQASGFGVPKENVIDLKKMQEEKEKQQSLKKEQSVVHKIRKIKFPRIHFMLRREKSDRDLVKEKVIVSQTKKPLTGTPFKKQSQPTPTEPKLYVQPEKLDFRSFQLPAGWQKKLIGFVIACLIIVLPVYIVDFYQQVKEAKGKVLGISSEAYKNLQEAGLQASASDFGLASQSFGKAAQNFVAAQQQLTSAGGIVLSVANIVPNQAKSAEFLLSAGNHLSQTGIIVIDLVSQIEDYSVNPLESEGVSLTDFLVMVRDELIPVGDHLKSAVDDLEKVRIKDLPQEYQEGLNQVKNILPALKSNFDNLFSVSDVMLSILGQDVPKRYLIIFQNNRELRPTGGFIGSIALMDIYKGKIENLEVPGGGVYDVAGQLKEKIIAPKPLWLVNPHWNIQDSNWFFDFPTTAEKIMWFFERTGGATVDGIITLTPTVIEELLDVVGPIDMEEYGLVVESSNFIREAQLLAEVTYDREENQPKKFIGDLLPILLDRVFQAKTQDFLNLLDVLNRSLTTKHFLLYFSDGLLEKKIQDLGWDGRIKKTEKDYLAVVSTNIAGGKTDHVIDQLIEHKASIQSDGSVINTVTVTRGHNGNSLDFWEGKTNVSYLRFYVPKGSRLLSVDGFDSIPAFRYQLPDEDAGFDEDLNRVETGSVIEEQSGTRITSEFDKTVFGNWVKIEPGEVKRVSIQYQLPFRLETGGWLDKSDIYSLLVQKQPGMLNNYFSSSIELADDYEFVWSQPGLSVSNYTAKIVTDLDTDKYFGVLLKK